MGRSAGYYSGDYSEAQTKIAQAMNLFMSGNAFLYYGEELGMKGSGKDENKRVGMYWSKDSNAQYMCDGPKDANSVKQKFDSLEEQKEDSASVYNYVKRLIKVRNTYPAIARGKNTLVEELTNDKVCAIRKTYENEEIILVFNISESESIIELSNVKIGDTNLTGENVVTKLFTGNQDITVSDGTITLPAYSVIILK